MKLSGDYLNMIKNEGLMIELNKKAKETGITSLAANTVAMPSQFEFMQKELRKKEELAKNKKITSLSTKYGN